MTSALVAQAPQTVADTAERKRLFMSLIVKGGTPDQIGLALGICDRYGFDPLLKHVVLISGQIYVTRDGLIHHAHQTGQLAGIEEREAVREADGKWRVTVAVFRKGYERAFVATAFQVEHENTASPVWQKAPYRMTVKCATVAALRLAFDISLGAAEEVGYDMQGTRTNIGEARFIEPTAGGPRVVEAIEGQAIATGMSTQAFADYVANLDLKAQDGIASREILAHLQAHDAQLSDSQRQTVKERWKAILGARKAGQPGPATVAPMPPVELHAAVVADPGWQPVDPEEQSAEQEDTWTGFWAWARNHGFNGRRDLDEAVGSSTSGMTPAEIRRQIEARATLTTAPVEADFVEVVGPPANSPADVAGPEQPIREAQRMAILSLAKHRGIADNRVLSTVQALLPEVMITDLAHITRGQVNQVLDGLRRLPLPEAQDAAVALGGQS